jgi:hypothetical protein
MHPREFTPMHLVRRVSQNEVRLLANVLPQVRPGQLLEAAAGRGEWPHAVFSVFWDRASAHSFEAVRESGPISGPVEIHGVLRESAA